MGTRAELISRGLREVLTLRELDRLAGGQDFYCREYLTVAYDSQDTKEFGADVTGLAIVFDHETPGNQHTDLVPVAYYTTVYSAPWNLTAVYELEETV